MAYNVDGRSVAGLGGGHRRGKWSDEEAEYAARLIHEFRQGALPIQDGTTLRTFLSCLLQCCPMRISKRFTGSNCIGKQVFHRMQEVLDQLSPEEIDSTRRELAELERRFMVRVAQMNRSQRSVAKSELQLRLCYALLPPPTPTPTPFPHTCFLIPYHLQMSLFRVFLPVNSAPCHHG